MASTGSNLSRRAFLSAALVGLTVKSVRAIEGSFVNESQVVGHRLRDGGPFPEPRNTRRMPIVIVGGGIAGLSAAWRLSKRGMRDFVVLEMEPTAGGNARSGRNDVSGFPWAAHYVPVPGREAGLVHELFMDLGLHDGTGWDERHLVHAPRERLFIHGRWQEGLEPQVGPTRRDRDQMERFEDRMRAFAATGQFTVPMEAGMARTSRPVGADISMAAWLDGEGFDSPWLRWMVDYACRDDYGALAADVSAWAGIHYFSSRQSAPGDDLPPFTWPEGNGWIVGRLLERIGASVHTGAPVHRIERRGTSWRVLTGETAWVADAVIVATPFLVASRILDALPRDGIVYSPWLTANLTLHRWPREPGLEPAWDNVLFDSPGLGYVVATHQQMRQYIPRTVWTYYWALAQMAPAAARQWLLAQDWGTLKDRILADLSRAHPDLSDCVSRIDIFRIGHAMVRPVPGFLSAPVRRAAQAGPDRLYFAHSDMSGLPLFEEAQFRGVAAADAALRALGRS